jgi:hypothetical protein
MGAAGQLGLTSHGRGSAGQSRGLGHDEVNVGGHGHCSLARCGFAAAASNALGASGADPGDNNLDIDYGNYNEDNDSYEYDASYSDDNDDDDDEALGEANAP